MSRKKSKRSTPKYQRAKLCTIPCLFAVLGYVLLADSGSEDLDAVPPATSLVAASARPRPASAGNVASDRGAKLPDWAELASSHRAQCNPFLPIPKEEEETVPPEVPAELRPVEPELAAATESSASEESTEPQPVATAVDVNTLSQQPVRYFFETNNRRVMLVGDKLLSEGETYNSYTVTHLDPNRIELQPADVNP